MTNSRPFMMLYMSLVITCAATVTLGVTANNVSPRDTAMYELLKIHISISIVFDAACIASMLASHFLPHVRVVFALINTVIMLLRLALAVVVYQFYIPRCTLTGTLHVPNNIYVVLSVVSFRTLYALLITVLWLFPAQDTITSVVGCGTPRCAMTARVDVITILSPGHHITHAHSDGPTGDLMDPHNNKKNKENKKNKKNKENQELLVHNTGPVTASPNSLNSPLAHLRDTDIQSLRNFDPVNWKLCTICYHVQGDNDGSVQPMANGSSIGQHRTPCIRCGC
jgi:hypothetical protein